MNQTPSNTDDHVAEIPQGIAELTLTASKLKLELEVAEATAAGLKDRLTTVQETILKTLDLMDLESIRAHGFLFFKEQKSSVTTPKTTEDKELLFAFLRERGIFSEMVSVNSMTLNSLYKTLANEAAADGNLDFKLPGVAEPKSYTTLKMRRS